MTREIVLRRCVSCDRLFQPVKPDQTTCSCQFYLLANSMSGTARSDLGRELHQIKCKRCGKVFQGRKHRQYCSRSCASKGHYITVDPNDKP